MKWYEDNRKPEDRTNPNFSCGPAWMDKIFDKYDSKAYEFFDYILGLTYFFNACYIHDMDYESLSSIGKFKADWKFYKNNLFLINKRETKFLQKARRRFQATLLFVFVGFPGISHISFYIAQKKGKIKASALNKSK